MGKQASVRIRHELRPIKRHSRTAGQLYWNQLGLVLKHDSTIKNTRSNCVTEMALWGEPLKISHGIYNKLNNYNSTKDFLSSRQGSLKSCNWNHLKMGKLGERSRGNGGSAKWAAGCRPDLIALNSLNFRASSVTGEGRIWAASAPLKAKISTFIISI